MNKTRRRNKGAQKKEIKRGEEERTVQGQNKGTWWGWAANGQLSARVNHKRQTAAATATATAAAPAKMLDKARDYQQSVAEAGAEANRAWTGSSFLSAARIN